MRNGTKGQLLLVCCLLSSVFSVASFGDPTISGYVQTAGGINIPGVTVAGDNGASSMVTGVDGFYLITLPDHWTGTITATLAGYNFIEPSRTYINVTGNMTYENFIAVDQLWLYGYVKDYYSAAVSNVTVSASGASPASTDWTGYYAIPIPYRWSGTLTATKSGYYFGEPISIASVTSNVRNDFVEKRFKIRGYVTDKAGVGLSGVSIGASGLANVSTSSNGYYELPVSYGWSGTVTPTKTGYSFNPANRTYTSINSDMDGENFAAIQVSISGTVRDNSGAALSAVTISASSSGGSTTTDLNGRYVLNLAYNWTGTITPSKAGYGFVPVNRTYLNVTADMDGEDFAGLQVKISGTVRGKSGAAISAVTINASSGESATTDTNGRYVFNLPSNWSGTITPSKTGYGFDPVSRTYTNITADVDGEDFTILQPTLSGTVTDMGGIGVAGVTISAGTDGSTTTGSDGKYALALPYNWSGTITPSKTGWLFSPTTRTYSSLAADQSDQNYLIRTPIISGYVRQASDNSPVADVNVTLSGVGSQMTDVNGFFSAIVPANWSGTVTMQKEGIVVSPVSFTNVSSDQSQTYYVYLPYAGGDGSDANPFLIETAAQLYQLCRQSGHWGKSFLVVNDINMVEFAEPPIFTPIGMSSIPFGGSFDGGGHVIKNLKILTASSAYNGLFGYVYGSQSKPAVIKNINLVDPQINLPGSIYIGGLVGNVYSYATIDNCHLSGGQIIGRDYTGGLFGAVNQYSTSSTFVTNCSVNTTVRGNYYVGGLAGSAACTIKQSYANCDVNGVDSVGGLVGTMSGAATDCYASGVTKSTRSVGGLIGTYSTGRSGTVPLAILNCYAACQINGVPYKAESYIGGLLGSIVPYQSPAPLTFLSCYWDTDVSGVLTSAAGVGRTTAQMKSLRTFTGWGCDGVWTMNDGADYPRLAWENKPGTALPEPIYSGGTGEANNPHLITTARQLNTMGQTYCHISKAFRLANDIDMSELEPNEFVPIAKGMSFTGIFDGNNHAIMNLNYRVSVMPALNTQTGIAGVYGGLFGQLGINVSHNVVSGTVKNLLLVDPVVDVNGSYAGALCGYSALSTIQNCRITNGTVKGKGYVGGTIGRQDGGKDIDIVFTGKVQGSTYTGGFAGYLYSSADTNECFSAADVNGSDYTGGFAGFTYPGSAIKKCGSKGRITGRTYVGGFTGYSNRDLNDCYSICDVNGLSKVGGFVGYVSSSRKVSRCYSEGIVDANNTKGAFAGSCSTSSPVTDFTSCYYNADKANISALGNITDADVKGKTTSQMREMSTYSNSGWDFAGETANGTADIWTICEGTNTPKFVWQISPADFVCPDGVNFADYSYFAARWLDTDCANTNNCGGADMDLSGTVDWQDILIFCQHWLDGL